jgi:hypothetical protein
MHAEIRLPGFANVLMISVQSIQGGVIRDYYVAVLVIPLE